MKLFYRKLGNGQPLLFLHGLFGLSDNWYTIGKVLSKDFEVFLVDLRNHGRSPFHPEHNYEVMKDDIVELMNDEGIHEAILLGHSMGGKTAMLFSFYFPERISKLIVVDISPKSYFNLPEFRFNWNINQNLIDAMLNIDLKKLEDRVEIENMLSQSIHSPSMRQLIQKNIRRNKENSFEWTLNLPVLKQNIVKIADGFNDFIKKNNPLVDKPVLFIKGVDSEYIAENDRSLIKSIYPLVEFAEIKNAGHWVHAEQPEAFVRAVSSFLLNH